MLCESVRISDGSGLGSGETGRLTGWSVQGTESTLALKLVVHVIKLNGIALFEYVCFQPYGCACVDVYGSESGRQLILICSRDIFVLHIHTHILCIMYIYVHSSVCPLFYVSVYHYLFFY